MDSTPKLNFPPINLRAKRENNRTLVFDSVRSIYVVLTPEEWVRRHLVEQGITSSRALNAAALEYVTAPRQASAMKKILDMLTEEEAAAFRRGRNIGHTNLPRAATASEYRSATGMEALMGWLHMEGRTDRIGELLSVAYGQGKSEE